MRYSRKLAIVLAAMMAGSTLTACESGKIGDYATTEVATYGKESIKLDEANFWLRLEQMQNESYMGMIYSMYYGVENMWTLDSGNGSQTMGEYMHEMVMTQIRQTRVLLDHAADYNIELTDAQKANVTEAIAEIHENYPNFTEFANVTDAQMQTWLEQNAKANLVIQAVKDAADVEITDEEVQAYAVEYINVTAPTEEETTEAAAEETTEAAAGETAEDAEETTEAAGETTEAAVEETTEAAVEETTEAAVEETTEAASEETAEAAGETTEAAAEEAETEEAEEEPALEGEELANKVLELAESGMDFEEIEGELDVTHYDTSYLVTGETSTDEKYTASAEMAPGEVKMLTTDSGWTILKKLNDLDEDATETRREEKDSSARKEAFNTVYAGWEEASQTFKVNEKIWSQLAITDTIYEAPTEEETEEALEEESESEAADEDVTAEAAETEAAETEAAETEAAETEAAETEAAETEAAETEAAETEAAETTESAAETTEAQ